MNVTAIEYVIEGAVDENLLFELTQFGHVAVCDHGGSTRQPFTIADTGGTAEP